MSDMWIRGHMPDTHRIRVRYTTWRIVDQIVGQRIWIRLGHDGDTAETRLQHDLDRFYGLFSSLGLKKP